MVRGPEGRAKGEGEEEGFRVIVRRRFGAQYHFVSYDLVSPQFQSSLMNGQKMGVFELQVMTQDRITFTKDCVIRRTSTEFHSPLKLFKPQAAGG